jgi:predicted metal-dependent HD superfamily phosphohydrolase
MQNAIIQPEKVWQELAGRYTTKQQLIFNRWRDLLELYYSPGRYYHTLDHIQYLLELAEQHKESVSRYDELLFAIFYHDVIYDVNSSRNEEKSAQHAILSLEDFNLSRQQLDFISEAILATQKHEKHPDPTINFLLDIDLAILGSDPETYDTYRHQIRREYSVYPDLLYKPGRKRVLQHFLKQPRIYKTEIFYRQLEEAARRNLQQELSYL